MPESGHALQVFREVALATAGSLDTDEILGIVRERARALFRADFTAVALAERGWGDLYRVDGGRTPSAQLQEIVRCVLRTGEPQVARDAIADEAQLPLAEWSSGTDGFRSAVAAPLRYGDQVRGVLVVAWHSPAPLTDDVVQLAETLGVHAAVALHNARLYEELKRSTLARDRFFSAMSHDLRTPIAAIVGYSELLADGIVGGLSPKQQEMVERIAQVAAHLTELVNDILDLAKLDAGRVELHPERVVLGEVVRDAVLAVEPQARAKELPLRLNLDSVERETVRVDAVRVRQILVNLLSNAVKFTDRGEVRVDAGLGGERTWIAVRDTGPGLPPGSEEAVFEEFLQIASGRGTKREPGSGLGLAVSRRLARAMGGDLVVESRPGEGSAFTLYLPLEREAPAEDAGPA
ncbi:MAG TPA: GAF domain-containing sensor histidine kinase [Longimicrobiaceae bacterium]|nr:GAF domain-containing sensor histidine kinase [Longimicrobiaceae bacterium]